MIVVSRNGFVSPNLFNYNGYKTVDKEGGCVILVVNGSGGKNYV